VIRQAISCDMCGTEKKQTNHWFVASDHGGELRLSGWNSRNRLRPGSKHLCGQTCLHKLVDDFMARSLSPRTQPAAGEQTEPEAHSAPTDTSLTSDTAHHESESSARLLPPLPPDLAKRVPVPPPPAPIAVPVPVQARVQVEAPKPPVPEEAPNYTSRNWKAEAWDRERERELRSAERRPDIAARRGGNT
jgi:hypothetical protein